MHYLEVNNFNEQGRRIFRIYTGLSLFTVVDFPGGLRGTEHPQAECWVVGGGGSGGQDTKTPNT